MRLWSATVALLLVCVSSRSGAANYTVPGDFPTIQAALNAAAAGDTINVLSGTYFEKLSFPHGGSAGGGYITLQAGSGQSPILDGTGVSGSNMVLIDTQSYVKLIGFEIRNNLKVNDGSGVRILGSGSNIEIRNNRIHDIRGRSAMGITVYGTAPTPISNLIIDGNQIYDCEPANSETLTLNGNVTDFQVTNNLVRDVNNIGIVFIGGERDIQPDPTKVARNGECRGNQVYHANSNYGGGFAGGIYVDGGQNIVIENNIVSQSDLGIEIGAENSGIIASGIVVRDNRVYANQKAGIVFGGFAASVGRTRNCQFLNNTCYHNDTLGTGFGELWIQFAENNVVENNVFYSTAQNVLVHSDEGNTSNTLNYNLWYTDAGAASAQFLWNGTLYSSFAAYRAGTAEDGNSAFGNPLLVAPANADFHVSSGSPAIDAGDPAFVPGASEVDIDGAPRVSNGRVDIGADEFTCGNGVVDPGETCDDSNLVDCDGCDSNCTLSMTCGNHIVCPPEQCDDGNTAAGDCCSPTCQLDAAGAPCDDGNPCTNADACNGTGTCVGSQTPQLGCRMPTASGAAPFTLKADADPRRNSTTWKWGKGQATLRADFADPINTTSYALCVYDESAGIASLTMNATVPPGGLCAGNACWKASSTRGFRYHDRNGSAGGVQSMSLTAGVDGKARISLKAKGVNLAMPSLPLHQDPRVIVQLKNSAGACWEADYSAPAATDTGSQFKDKSD